MDFIPNQNKPTSLNEMNLTCMGDISFSSYWVNFLVSILYKKLSRNHVFSRRVWSSPVKKSQVELKVPDFRIFRSFLIRIIWKSYLRRTGKSWNVIDKDISNCFHQFWILISWLNRTNREFLSSQPLEGFPCPWFLDFYAERTCSSWP